MAFKCHDPPKSKTSEDRAGHSQDCACDLTGSNFNVMVVVVFFLPCRGRCESESQLTAVYPPIAVSIFMQDGCNSVRAAAGPGEEQDAAQWSGYEGSRIQNQFPRSVLHPEK